MDSFDGIVGRLRAAAEPTRLRILRLLLNGEFNVKDLTQLLGQSQPRVSRHIRLLAEAGLIDRYQEGSWVFVRSSPNPVVRQFVAAALDMIREDDPQIVLDRERTAQLRAERAALAQSYFDRNAAAWDRIRSLHIPEKEVEEAILDALGTGPYGMLLDLGTGTGRILELTHARARQCIGVDSNREMLRCARVRLDNSSLANCSVRLADIYNLPFPEASADAVIIHQVLHFLDNPKAALTEAVRVLSPGGRIVVIDFARHNLEFLREDYAHVRLGFGGDEVTSWLEENDISTLGCCELRSAKVKENALTVVIWAGQKAGAAATQWRAAS